MESMIRRDPVSGFFEMVFVDDNGNIVSPASLPTEPELENTLQEASPVLYSKKKKPPTKK